MPRAKKHHNNKGYRQIKTGKTADALERVAARLGVQFIAGKPPKKAIDTKGTMP